MCISLHVITSLVTAIIARMSMKHSHHSPHLNAFEAFGHFTEPSLDASAPT